MKRARGTLLTVTGLLLGLSAATALLPAAQGGAGVAAEPLEFALIADVQYCDCDRKGSRYYRDSLSKLRAAGDVINRRQVNFTLQLGDLIDRYPESFDRVLPLYERIDGPRFHVLGNHDFPISSRRVVNKLGMPSSYYDFTRQGWRFVVLDTNDISLYANEPGTQDYETAEQMLAALREAGAPNAQTWNGAAGDRQRTWLRAVLRDTRAKGQRVIVFGHMPVHGRNAHNAWDDAQLRQLLQSSGNVAAYFNGHNHAGDYGRAAGVHYVNLEGMVEQPTPSTAFAFVRVTPDAIRIDGRGREPDRLLAVTNGP